MVVICLDLSLPKGRGGGIRIWEKLKKSFMEAYILIMNYRTVGVLAGYRGRRVASQWGALLRVPQAKKPP